MKALNIYATIEEVKDQIDKTGSESDAHILSLLSTVSRLIDKITGYTFYPESKTFYLNADSDSKLFVPANILEIASISVSSDNGDTYDSLALTDYFLTNGFDFSEPFSCVELNPNGDQGTFYPGFRSVKISGLFGYHDDYQNAWVDTYQTVQDNPLLVNSNTLSVTDIDAGDSTGLYSAISLGNLLKIGSEFLLPTSIDTDANTATILRSVNGTNADEHAQSTPISKWSVHPIIKQAAIIQAVRTWKRSENAFQDTTANAATGQLRFLKKLDPEVEMLLYNSKLVRVSIG